MQPVGEQYGLIISSTTSTGCHGFAYSDTNPSAAGRELCSNDGGTTWRAEANRHLHATAIVT